MQSLLVTIAIGCCAGRRFAFLTEKKLIAGSSAGSSTIMRGVRDLSVKVIKSLTAEFAEMFQSSLSTVKAGAAYSLGRTPQNLLLPA